MSKLMYKVGASMQSEIAHLNERIAAADAMAKALERFNQYYESDFIRVSAEDGRTLAEQMHSMRTSVDAYNALR